jgi:hypothetical protein
MGHSTGRVTIIDATAVFQSRSISVWEEYSVWFWYTYYHSR